MLRSIWPWKRLFTLLVACASAQDAQSCWSDGACSVEAERYLQVDEVHVHPTKRMAYRSALNVSFNTLGVPLRMGWEAGQRFEKVKGIDYQLHSVGKYCNNNGLFFIVEGLFAPEECEARCTLAPSCAFVTVYSNGWCQLSNRCSPEEPAGDRTSMTFVKTWAGKKEQPKTCSAPWGHSAVQCAERSPDTWVGNLGKPIGLRQR
mmetsp:Transcript_13790/g.30945  ORF Transcript_13790/g.30945 Transcript_13790/m.30945 type:complete len:204 (+) Transcript_13790:88-699(+)